MIEIGAGKRIAIRIAATAKNWRRRAHLSYSGNLQINALWITVS
ncbi:MAG TPA: hypothetical protein VNS11_07290 [Sphingomicrobium sp.]|nr:hypothetical protein [Sphingomicrobium sp.]